MHALMAYYECMKKNRTQYTLRDIPERLDRRLREMATEYTVSLNRAAISALEKGVGLADQVPAQHDLDDLAGTWVPDPAFDQAIAEMDQIDEDLWK